MHYHGCYRTLGPCKWLRVRPVTVKFRATFILSVNWGYKTGYSTYIVLHTGTKMLALGCTFFNTNKPFDV